MNARYLTAAVAALVLALGALGLTACGGGDDESDQTAAWADGFCSSISTWATSVRSTAQELGQGQITKSKLEDSVDEFSDATNKLADDLKGLGKPDTPNADEAKSAIDDLASDLKSSADDIKDTVSNISSAADLSSALASVGTALTSIGSSVNSAVSRLEALGDDQEWEQAFSQSEACKKLTSS